MSERLHIAEPDLTLYAMGALSPVESTQVKAHLEACARCKEEVRQSTLALAAYAQTTPEVAPLDGAKERFMARVAKTPQGAALQASRAAGAPSVETQKASFWQRVLGSGAWSGALAGALAVLLAGVGLDDLKERAEIRPLLHQAQKGAIDSAQLNELMELLTSPQAQKVALNQSPVAAPPPEGRVVYAARTGKLLMTATNLKPLPAGKTYELWILQPDGKKPLPAGTFAPDSAGYAAMILANAPAGLTVQGFGVTVENAGGAETPTLPIVLSGT
jgi:anti-sigma-K factor RskA